MLQLRYSKYWYPGTDEDAMRSRDNQAAKLREEGSIVDTFTSDELIPFVTYDNKEVYAQSKVYTLIAISPEEESLAKQKDTAEQIIADKLFINTAAAHLDRERKG